MIKAVVPAFVFATLVILSASAFAPRDHMVGEKGCDLAYGVEGCKQSVEFASN